MADDTFKRTMVIDYVQPSPRKWENPKGADLFFVTVIFSDGTEGSVGVIESKVDEALASLNALKGTPTEYELKQGKEYNGVQQYRLYDWPGKPQGLGGGRSGGGGGGGGMAHSQAGYMAAASALSGIFAADRPAHAVMAAEVVELGELITDALFTRQPKQQAPAGTSTESSTPAASDTLSLAQVKQLREAIQRTGNTIEQACESLGVQHLTSLSPSQADEAIEYFNALAPA